VQFDISEASNTLDGLEYIYRACACVACWGDTGRWRDWYLYSVDGRAPTEAERQRAKPDLELLRKSSASGWGGNPRERADS